MSSIASWIGADNPVLTKEMRTRMRGARSYWILFGYLLFVAVTLLISYDSYLQFITAATAGQSQITSVGSSILSWIVGTQVFLVLFVTPALTSGALTLEKEQRTLDMLTITPIHRGQIVAGKLLAAFSFTALLIVASLPLVSICFMFGGLDPGTLLSQYLMLLLGGLFVGAVGLGWSSVARSTTTAVLSTYLTILLTGATGWTLFMASAQPQTSAVGETAITATGAVLFGMRGSSTVIADIGASLLMLSGALVISVLAGTRLHPYPGRLAWRIRLGVVLVLTPLAFFVSLWWIHTWYARGSTALLLTVQQPIGALELPALFILVLTPIFATGRLTSAETRALPGSLARGLSLRGLGTGDALSAPPYTLLMSGLFVLAFVTAFAVSGHPAAALHAAHMSQAGRPVSAGGILVGGRMVYPPGASGAPPAAAAPPAYSAVVGDLPQAALVLAACAVGLSLFCILISTLIRNRWVACFCVYIIMVAAAIIPQQAMAGADAYSPPGAGAYAFALDPLMPIGQMADPAGYRAQLKYSPLADQPLWAWSAGVWSIIGIASLLLLSPIGSLERRRPRETGADEEA